MNNIVNLAGFKCPEGSMAMHAMYGLVEVFAQDGWKRGILYEHHEELSLDDEAEDVVFAENIEIREAWVDVRELKEANLLADVQSSFKRGQLF